MYVYIIVTIIFLLIIKYVESTYVISSNFNLDRKHIKFYRDAIQYIININNRRLQLIAERICY